MLIRRLATEHFVLLMPAGVQVNGALLLSAMAELPQLLLGQASVESQMQEQGVDGGLNRYLVTMSEPTLGGLLAGTDVACTLSWGTDDALGLDPALCLFAEAAEETAEKAQLSVLSVS